MTASLYRLLAFAGRLREGACHRRLIPVLAAGAPVSLIERRDGPLPVHDDDIGSPAAGVSA